MRFVQRKRQRRSPTARGCLRIGFIPTIDCAILIAAHELALFEKHGLNLKLSKEVGWTTIKEKLLHEELDAVHAHPSMAFSIYCGLGGVRRPCLTGLVMALNGSAITLSNELWELGVRDAQSLGEIVRAMKGRRTLHFGAVLEFSSQNHNLRRWLRTGGIEPGEDVKIEVVPSPLMHESMREGHLDGYCVAEPWNTMAIREGTGWIAATSAEIEPRHPEKVLLVLQDFAEERGEEHLHMLAALIEAGAYCEDPANRPELVRMLSQSQYFDVEPSLLANSLIGPFNSGRGRLSSEGFISFYNDGANVPDRAKGTWVFNLMRSLDTREEPGALRRDAIAKVFRQDIYDSARERANPCSAGPF